MKTYSIIAVAALAATFAVAGNAIAAGPGQGEATYDYPQATQSATSRAAVLAELQAARAAGTVLSGEADALQRQSTALAATAVASRNTVAAGSVQGAVNAVNSKPTQGAVSRAQVKAELQAARAAGTVVSGEADPLQIQPVIRGASTRPMQRTVSAMPLNG